MNTIGKHTLFWSAYFGYCCITDFIVDSDAKIASELLFFITQNLYLFYAFLFFLRTFNRTYRYPIVKRTILFLIIVIVFEIVRYIVRYYVLNFYFSSEYGRLPFNEWLVSGVIWMSNYFIFSCAFFYFERSIDRQKNINKILEDSLLAEKRTLELENSLLRTQINPHFLYNTLNFFYAKSLPVSSDLSEGILKLSYIMRYSLRTQDPDGLVFLSEELTHIDNVIELAKLRFNNKLHLQTHFAPVSPKIRILPLLLITLVENIFKHGDPTDQTKIARIDLEAGSANSIVFSTYNKKSRKVLHESSGLGIKNMTSRLKAFYGPLFNLQIKDGETDFFIQLTLPTTEG